MAVSLEWMMNTKYDGVRKRLLDEQMNSRVFRKVMAGSEMPVELLMEMMAASLAMESAMEQYGKSLYRVKRWVTKDDDE